MDTLTKKDQNTIQYALYMLEQHFADCAERFESEGEHQDALDAWESWKNVGELRTKLYKLFETS